MKEYEFLDVALTAYIGEKLILNNLKPLKKYKNEEIRDTIINVHVQNGGRVHEGRDVWRNVFKKALKKLKDEGKAKNVSYGVWEFLLEKENFIEDIGVKEIVEIMKPEKTILRQKEIEPKCILGDESLKGFVYLYYYPIYKEKGVESWPCKIGCSKDRDYGRIWNQVGTAMPEIPELELVIYHEKYEELEKFIHMYFKMKGKHRKEARGEEWFQINPSELFSFLVKNEIVKYEDLSYLK